MKMKRNLVCLLCLFLLILAAVGITVVGAAETENVTAGIALEDIPILKPQNPTAVELSAASELQNYIRKMTGKTPVIMTEYSGCSAGIFVGDTQCAKDNNVTFTDNNGLGEGWAIRVVGKKVIVTGGKDRGVLYGAYHLLEDVLGVRWWNMWEEYVPSVEDAVIPEDYADSGEPAFAHRDIYLGAEKAETLFLARNRMNGTFSNAPAAYGDEISFGLPYFVHTFGHYFPASTYFATNPEWYAWDADTQTRISDGQLCMSNEEVLDALIVKVLNKIQQSYNQADKAGKLRPAYIDISPNDADGFCECDECLAARAASGPSGHLLQFVNRVAEAVAAEYPELKVETLAYHEYLDVPLDDTVPADNVVVRLANSGTDMLHDLDHPNNAKGKEYLKRWSALVKPGQLMYWDYGMLTQRMYGILPNYFRFQDDYREIYEAGCVGMFTEIRMMNCADLWDMNVWLLAKIIEDPYQDVHALTKDFLEGYYGAAAAYDLYSYLELMTACAENYSEPVYVDTEVVDAPWLTAADVMQANAYFESAVAKLAADTSISDADRTLYQQRINAARKGLDQVILYNYTEYAEEIAKSGQLLNINKNEVGVRLVETLNWLNNMTAGEDHTGVQNVLRREEYNSNATYLLSRYARYRGETDADGNIFYPEIPQKVMEDHPGLDSQHIYDYTASSFVCDSNYAVKVDNAASYQYGSAAVIDQEVAFAYNAANGLSDRDRYFKFSENTYLDSNMEEKWQLGAPLTANTGYQLYCMEDAVFFVAGRPHLSLFGGAVTLSFEGLEQLYNNNKPADVYISMKIEGDPSGEDSTNYAKFYIDRIIIVESCENYNITAVSETPATCASNATQTGLCPVCGKETTVEIEDTKLPHDIIGGYTYDASVNAHLASCSICGDVAYPFMGRLPSSLLTYLAAEDIGLEHIYEYDVTDFELGYLPQIVKDAESLVGKAVMFDVWKTDNPLSYVMTESSTWPVRTNVGLVGKLTYDELNGNENNGYQVYKLDNCVLPAGSYGYSYYWSFLNGQMISRQMMRELQLIGGHTVDIYISMKIEGDLDGRTSSAGGLKYYLDRIFVVDVCANYIEDTTSSSCPKCGGSYTWDNLLAPLPAELMAELAASGTGFVHIYDYDYNDFVLSAAATDSKYATFVEDTDSVMEQVLKIDSYYLSDSTRNAHYVFNDSQPMPVTSYGSGKNVLFGNIKAAEMAQNTGKYHLYKLSGSLITAGHAFTHFFNNTFRNTFADLRDDGLYDHTVDFYLSMKVVGDVTGTSGVSSLPKYYIDRMIVVDLCENYITEDSVVETPAACEKNATRTVTCSRCGNATVTELEGTALEHSYGEFVLNTKTNRLEATCVNGCGEVATKDGYYYTVTFNNDGVNWSEIIMDGTAVAEPTAPTKDGYKFLGWYNGDVAYDFTAPVTSNLILVAKYEEEVVEPEYLVEYKAIGMALDAKIMLQFKSIIPEELLNDENAYAIVAKDSKLAAFGYTETKYTAAQLRDLGTDNSGRTVIEVGLASPELTSEVTLKFFDGNGNPVKVSDYIDGSVGTEIVRSGIDYLKLGLEKGNAKQKALFPTIAAYGGYAQLYFKADMENPAYNILPELGYTIPTFEEITASTLTQTAVEEGSDIGIAFTSQSPSLDAAICNNVYLALDADQTADNFKFELTTIDLNGVESTAEVDATYNADKHRCEIMVPNIASCYLDYMYKITATNLTTNETYSVSTSVMVWAKTGLEKSTNAAQIALIKAMYNYSQAANTYFGK